MTMNNGQQSWGQADNSWVNQAQQQQNQGGTLPGMENDGAFDWDGEIVEESSFIILEPGVYSYQVTGFDRGYFDGSENLSPCPKAMLELTVKHPNGDVKLREQLLLHKKLEWKLSQFFLSIGQKKEGEPLRMDWSKVLTSTGFCKVSNEEYNGRTYNRVDEFLKPDYQG